jgi:hypothetical protein
MFEYDDNGYPASTRSKPGPKTQPLHINDPDVSYDFKNIILEKYGQTFLNNSNNVRMVVQKFVSDHAASLAERAPLTKVRFNDMQKGNIFKAIKMPHEEMKRAINGLNKNDIDLRNSVINDTFNEICSLLTSFYYQNKDKFQKPKNNDMAYPHYFAALYLGIRAYYSAFNSSFPKANPNPDVMDYTIEHVSEKFLFKQGKNIFEVIQYIVTTNIESMSERLLRGADIDIVYFNVKLDTRFSGAMKSIAKEYYKNNAESNKTKTEDTKRQDDEGKFFVGNTTNISSALEQVVRKIVIQFTSESTIDMSILEPACTKTKLSKSKMVVIITRIREANNPKLTELLTNIIMYYLTETRQGIDTIKSREFIVTMLNVYSVSNTKNVVIIKIKQLLEDIIKENAQSIVIEGKVNMLDRVKQSLYIYLVLFICKNIE